jgi:hypothetical protein
MTYDKEIEIAIELLNQGKNPAFLRMFTHIRDKNGEIQYQGCVIGGNETHAFVNRFSYLDGRATDIYCVPLSEYFSNQHSLYIDKEEFILSDKENLRKEDCQDDTLRD